jgi:hypothetical protein
MKMPYSDPVTNTVGWSNMPMPPANRDARQYRPAHPLSEVVVPLALAGVSAAAALTITTWLCMEIDWLPAEWVIPLATFITFVVVWVWRLSLTDDNLLALDEQTRVEPKSDLPQPIEASYIHIDMAIKKPDGKKQLRRFQLPCTDETLIQVAESMLGGSLLQESEWAGKSRGKPFSQGSLRTFKTTLITQGIARWMDSTNPKLGIRLTDKGQEFMQQVLDQDAEDDGK